MPDRGMFVFLDKRMRSSDVRALQRETLHSTVANAVKRLQIIRSIQRTHANFKSVIWLASMKQCVDSSSRIGDVILAFLTTCRCPES